MMGEFLELDGEYYFIDSNNLDEDGEPIIASISQEEYEANV
jgi:hypothetical protein